MNSQNQGEPGTVRRQPRYLPVLLLLFLGSGCAALIYEIVWLQLLQLVIGSSAVSLGLLLGTFMGGMCLGSLVLAKIIRADRHPLRVYAALELIMAFLGVAVLYGVPAVGRIYAPHAGQGLMGIFLRGLVASICLLPPTMLMGATLPAISRWVEATTEGMSWLGLFYAGNTAGAVIGCLLAGFYLLRLYNMAVATYCAAAINLTVALAAFALASVTAHEPPAKEEKKVETVADEGTKLVYVTIALSGFCALAAEVIWTRLLSLLMGGTVYTFSIILAVFLSGLGIGSTIGSLVGRATARPRIALGWCQMLLAAAMAWSAFMLSRSLPYWPVRPDLASNPWFTFQLDLVRCAWALLPATVLWGASFPLALAAVASRSADPGRLVGRVYAANTVGAIAGALLTSIVFIAWLGTQQTQRVLIAVSVLSAILMLFGLLPTRKTAESTHEPAADPPWLLGVAALLVALVCALCLEQTVQGIPWQLVAHGRYMATYGDDREKLYMGEGMNASVAVTKLYDTGVRNFHISGKIEASTDPQDMKLQRMLGHLPALFHPNPRSVLVVGCGAGITAGSFLTYPSVTNIVICEIEPLIPRVVAGFFSNENYNVVHDPRVRIVFDDARHFVLTTPEKFDIITSDPIHPWVKGAATLYTEDYFELCKQHLNPGGLVTQWVPLYESDMAAVKSEVATFFAVFPNGTLWNNDEHGEGYDTVVLGSVEPLRINLDQMQDRFDHEGGGRVKESLDSVGFKTIFNLLSSYGGRASDLQPWMADAQINNDRNLRLQYLAGLASDSAEATKISDSILAYRKFPDDIFLGDAQRKEALRLILEAKSK